ncbi:MAG: hypothetical protein HY515_04540 [Candidatus Aenigmarchaeota archaeon]|nr:hypothetical protein [Candidatus Aenigmarchaeota archaeon]
MIFGFDEMTIALLFIFAFFVLVTYSLLRLVFRVATIAIISMAFPVVLNYFGLYGNISVNNILIFGILGSFLYITYFFVDKLLGLVWPAFGAFTKKEKPEKHKKKQRKKHKPEEEEVEIPDQ